MSSQFSESALSDILPDVEGFIKDEKLTDHLNALLENEHKQMNVSNEEFDDYLYSSLPTQELQDHDYKLPTGPLINSHLVDDVNNFNYVEPLQYPPDESPTLEVDEYPGHHDFEVLILPNGQKTPWEYSTKLNKIYIAMGLRFPVAFSLKNRLQNIPLFVRATPVYSQLHQSGDLVHRCVGHENESDASNRDVARHIHQHIIRCANQETRYCGNRHMNKRLSLVTPLSIPQAGADTVKEYYSFVCKNSCTPGGMNRRPIQVIFTLENRNGEVLGRRVLSVRICSCPKRDKAKEESESTEKYGDAPPGKKRKMNSNDNHSNSKVTADNKIYAVNFNIVGKENYKKILEISRGLMATELMNENKASNSNHKKCYKEISDLLNKIV